MSNDVRDYLSTVKAVVQAAEGGFWPDTSLEQVLLPLQHMRTGNKVIYDGTGQQLDVEAIIDHLGSFAATALIIGGVKDGLWKRAAKDLRDQFDIAGKGKKRTIRTFAADHEPLGVPGPNPWMYAWEISLVDNGKPSPLGRSLLRLRGRDAIRWLLTMETEQSTGPWDPWRLSPDLVRSLLRDPILSDADPDASPRMPERTRRRLAHLGLAHRVSEDDPTLLLTDSARDLLAEVVSPEAAFRPAVQAMLSDLNSGVVSRSPLPSDTAGILRQQGEMILHRLGNVFPAIHRDLDRILGAVADPDVAATVGPIADRVRERLSEMDAFARRMVAPLGSVPGPRALLGRLRDRGRGSRGDGRKRAGGRRRCTRRARSSRPSGPLRGGAAEFDPERKTGWCKAGDRRRRPS